MLRTLKRAGTNFAMALYLVALAQNCLRGQLAEDFRINLQHSNGMCREFRFPAWTSPEQGPSSLTMNLEFLSSPSLGGDLLVRLRSAVIPDLDPRPEEYFQETYRINPRVPRDTVFAEPQVLGTATRLNYLDTPTSTAEWERRVKRANDADRDGFQWNERKMAIRGKDWINSDSRRILISPKESFVALQSVTGKWIGNVQQGPAEYYGGRFYMQIYDLDSAKEVLWVEVLWKDGMSWKFTQNTEWIQDDLLKMSFDFWLKEKVILCKVER